jgi:hypothetical protein
MKDYKYHFLGLIGLILLGTLTVTAQERPWPGAPDGGDEHVFCTLDAFRCPDGSWVGRTGPRCEFVCPDGSVKDDRDIPTVNRTNGNPDERAQSNQDRRPASSDPSEPTLIRDIRVESNTRAGIEVDGDSLRVRATEVRTWSEETKAMVRERLAENMERADANDFGLYVALKALDNERILDIRVEEEGNDGEELAVEVTYRARLRVFGLFEREAEASAYTAGESERVRTTVRALWYVRWFSVNADARLMAEVAKEVKMTGHVTLMK